MEDESAPFGNGLEQKDLGQTKRMKLENILRNYEKENFQDLMDKEWVELITYTEMLQKIQRAQKCKLWTM